MSSVNTDLIIGILSEKHPSISIKIIERMVQESTEKSFDRVMNDVESQIVYEEEKEVTPPRRRIHLLDFSRNW
ncbi:hypothetical protein VP14_023 [Vibrio phage VPMCC14]|nr:hypothetical protein VP14_023 [Vibrio phage VPMCC14]